MTKKPIAVLISDIHFTVATLEKASDSLRMAQHKAVELNIPLIIAGDTLDSKAIIRGECANRLIGILDRSYPKTYILVGNHDLLNEKGEEHSLEFLKPYVTVVDSPTSIDNRESIIMLPYYSNLEHLKYELASLKEGSIIVCHQGVQTAKMGHYVQDKTSLPPEAFDGLRVVSGHYHSRQFIMCGKTGLFNYIGNPYTLSFGEANDPPKGFQILYSNGSLEFVPTNLQKHIVVERNVSDIYPPIDNYASGDLVWLKVTGPYMELEKLNKQEIGQKLLGHSNFKFTKIPTDSKPVTIEIEKFTDGEILDKLIDNTDEHVEEKDYLKNLWREVME